MENAFLKLREIVWEITGACNNGCKFCGSKDVWQEKIDTERIKKIVDEIINYKPQELDVSGGDPLLVPLEIHQYIEYMFSRSAGIKCKILANPKSIKCLGSERTTEIFKLYSHIGISINDQETMDCAKSFSTLLSNFSSKITYITNFNLSNVFLFDEIKNFVGNNLWMIQFTVYDKPNELALYENDGALAFLNKKIKEAQGARIIVADNANSFACTAGLNSCGILSDGSVVPCLSMRCWSEDISKEIQGNILQTPLETIWKEKFSEQRFSTFKCCKDHCSRKCIELKSENDSLTDYEKAIKKLKPFNPEQPIAIFYGVFPADEFGKLKPKPRYSPGIQMYAVGSSGTFIYGVPDRFDSSGCLYCNQPKEPEEHHFDGEH